MKLNSNKDHLQVLRFHITPNNQTIIFSSIRFDGKCQKLQLICCGYAAYLTSLSEATIKSTEYYNVAIKSFFLQCPINHPSSNQSINQVKSFCVQILVLASHHVRWEFVCVIHFMLQVKTLSIFIVIAERFSSCLLTALTY